MTHDKAKVEQGVLLTQRWVVAVLRRRQFFSLGPLNEAIRELVDGSRAGERFLLGGGGSVLFPARLNCRVASMLGSMWVSQ